MLPGSEFLGVVLCAQGHRSSPPSVFFEHEALFEQGDPWERIRKLEGTIALLSGGQQRLRAALRRIMHEPAVVKISDHRMEPWYLQGMQALQLSLEPKADEARA